MNLPNKLTLLRLILIPFFIAAFYLGFFAGHYFVALGIFVVASLTDFLDGYIARKYNMITDFGKLADPVADKLMQFAMLIALTFNIKYMYIN